MIFSELREKFAPFFALVPDGYECVIAGGAMIMDGKESDVDIWVRSSRLDEGTFDEFQEHVLNQGAVLEGAGTNDTYSSTLKFTKMFEGTLKGKKFQIFSFNPVLDIRGLLAQFDLSCCQVALSRDGQITFGEDYSNEASEIRITNFATPAHTFTRLAKYLTRLPKAWYRPADYNKLLKCEMAVAKKKLNPPIVDELTLVLDDEVPF